MNKILDKRTPRLHSRLINQKQDSLQAAVEIPVAYLITGNLAKISRLTP